MIVRSWSNELLDKHCSASFEDAIRPEALRAIRAFQQMIVRKRMEAEGPWVCHLCGNGDTTPWDPGTPCPNYPCQAFKRPSD